MGEIKDLFSCAQHNAMPLKLGWPNVVRDENSWRRCHRLPYFANVVLFGRIENPPLASKQPVCPTAKSVARSPGLDKDFRFSLASLPFSSPPARENERPWRRRRERFVRSNALSMQNKGSTSFLPPCAISSRDKKVVIAFSAVCEFCPGPAQVFPWDLQRRPYLGAPSRFYFPSSRE